MALVGNLRDFALHDFLFVVDRGRKTGSLILRRPGASTALYFDRGKLIAVCQPERHERLGELLVRLGKITPEQLQQALDAQQRNNVRPIGQILVEQGHITEADLQASVQLVIENTVYDLFGWREGEFAFESGTGPAPDEILTPVPMTVEHLIMEGVRRVDEMTRVRERIPSDDAVVRLTPLADDQKGEVKLTADERRVFARIDNRSTVREIAQQLSRSVFDVSRIIFGLSVYGLVEAVPPPGQIEDETAQNGAQADKAATPAQR